jgi:hypothetical protein
MPSESDDKIHYDPSLNKAAPPFAVKPNKPEAGDQKTLLALMFWALHTEEGREFFRTHKWNKDTAELSAEDRKALIEKCLEYGVTREDLQDAIIEAQVAGEQFAQAYKDRRFDEFRTQAEAVYMQKMAFITWCLWEDTKGHEFSLGW